MENKLLLKLSFIITSLFFLSCSTMDMIFHPENYKKKTYADEKIYVYDTLEVFVNSEGQMDQAIAGQRIKKQVILREIGDSTKFMQGENIELISDGIDFSRASIQAITNESTDEVTLKVVDKYFEKIVFTEKCQCYNLFNINQIPPIEVVSGLNPQQVIVTPIFNEESCDLIGYQIRYGDQKIGGCWKEAEKVYNRFLECTNSYSARKHSKQRQKKNLGEILFGECKMNSVLFLY